MSALRSDSSAQAAVLFISADGMPALPQPVSSLLDMAGLPFDRHSDCISCRSAFFHRLDRLSFCDFYPHIPLSAVLDQQRSDSDSNEKKTKIELRCP